MMTRSGRSTIDETRPLPVIATIPVSINVVVIVAVNVWASSKILKIYEVFVLASPSIRGVLANPSFRYMPETNVGYIVCRGSCAHFNLLVCVGLYRTVVSGTYKNCRKKAVGWHEISTQRCSPRYCNTLHRLASLSPGIQDSVRVSGQEDKNATPHARNNERLIQYATWSLSA